MVRAFRPLALPQSVQDCAQVNCDLVRRFGARSPQQRGATVDQDSTIIKSHKQQALPTCEEPRSYRPTSLGLILYISGWVISSSRPQGMWKSMRRSHLLQKAWVTASSYPRSANKPF